MRAYLILLIGLANLAIASPSVAQDSASVKDYFIGINRHVKAGGGVNAGVVQGIRGERTMTYAEAGMIEDNDFGGPYAGMGYNIEVGSNLFVGGVMSIGYNLHHQSEAALLRFAVGAEARYLLWETLQLRAGYTYGHGFTVGYAIQW